MSERTVATVRASLLVVSVCLAANPWIAEYSAALSVQDTQRPRPGESAEKIGKELVPRFGEITPTLFRGAQPRKHAFETLANMGIQIVVDLRGDRRSEREEVTRLGMLYVPMHWECSFPKDKIFAQFLTLLRKNPGKKVFVHCRVGDDRTGMMIAAYRMAEESWSAKRAKDEMESYGFSFIHQYLICPRLASYEAHFPQRFATKPEFKELRLNRNNRPLEAPPTSTEHDPSLR